MNIEDAIEYIIDGEGLLFLGAGFSTNATNILGNKLVTATTLSEDLCKELKIPINPNLSDVTDYYMGSDEIEDADKKLVSKLIEYYRCNDIEDEHKEIADLDWIRVYTTNYDNVFELASNRVNKRRTGYIISDEMKYIERKNSILHINGYIEKLTIDQLNDQFKLTTTSYMREDFSDTKWCGLFRNDLARARVVVLIGVSMDYDEQLQKMLSENPNYKNKIIFIDRKESKTLLESIEENPMYKYKKRKYGEIYEMDTKGFADKVEIVKKRYKPKSRKMDFRAFTHINNKEFDLDIIDVNDYWSLLIYGDVNESLIFNNITNNKYIINREQFKDFDVDINSNDVQVAIIHSDLGNGKTCSAKKLSHMLKDKGEVFWLDDGNLDVTREIEEICDMPGRKFVFIENYGNFFGILSKFKIYLDDSVKLILTERTSIHFSIYCTLKETIGVDDNYIREYDLNKIFWGDLDNLTYILDKVDKWDERGLNSEAKKVKLSKDYQRSFREILIKLVRSKEVSKKIDTMYNNIKENRIKKSLLLAVCINSVINTGLELNDIITLLDIKVSNNIIRDTNMNELLDFKSNVIRARSSILAEYILHSNNLKNDILEIMKRMAVKANKLKYGNKIEAVIKDFVSSSNMLLVLRKKDEKICEDILGYYDDLKDAYKRNPFFYLQYAMACLDMKYYDRAGEYINIAYKEAKLINDRYNSIKKGKKFDTFQIDTQNGRYMLERAIEEKNEANAFKTFLDVHNLFITTLNKEKTQKHLVYRQLINYKLYFETYKGQFSYDERKRYIILTKEMVEEMECYEKSNGDLEIRGIIKQLNLLTENIVKSMFAS